MHTSAKPWGATRTGARTSAQHRRLERALGTLERAAERAAEVVAEALATSVHRAEQAWVDGAQSGFTDFGARLAALRRSLADERERRDPAALTRANEAALEAARAWCESAKLEALSEATATGESDEGIHDDEAEAERHHALGRAAALAEVAQQLCRLGGPRASAIRRPNVQTFRRPLPRHASIRQSAVRDRRLPSA